MNKKSLITKIILVLIVSAITFTCVACNNKDNHNHGDPETNPELLEGTSSEVNVVLKDDPTVIVPATISKIKDKLGDRYYPNKEMTEAEICELLGIKKEDCKFMLGHACDNGKYDMVLALRAEDGKMDVLLEAVRDYVAKQTENKDLPEKVRLAYNGCVTLHNPDGYIYLLAIFGDIDNLDNDMIAQTVELQGDEVSGIIIKEVNQYYEEVNPEK